MKIGQSGQSPCQKRRKPAVRFLTVNDKNPNQRHRAGLATVGPALVGREQLEENPSLRIKSGSIDRSGGTVTIDRWMDRFSDFGSMARKEYYAKWIIAADGKQATKAHKPFLQRVKDHGPEDQ
jgi:hypothetical protein